METQKEVEIVKKFPDIFNDKVLLENATKKRQIQDRFREIAKKVFMKPKETRDDSMAQPKLVGNHSTPVHHHLIHKCPEQWLHEHLGHAGHHPNQVNQHSDEHEHKDKVSFGDFALMALKDKKTKADGRHSHDNSGPTRLEDISEVSELKAEESKEVDADQLKKDNLNDSREVNLPKSDANSACESDTVFEEDELPVLKNLAPRRSLVKMDDQNVDAIKSFLERGELSLGITLLKRLRKYKLISSTVHHDGKIIVGISPRNEGRIKVVS